MSLQSDTDASQSAVGAAAKQRSFLDGQVRLLTLDAEKELSAELAVSRLDVQREAVRAGVLPHRYRRNLGTIGLEGQLRLLESRALVVGAGGLGGYLIEGLARMGVGRISVVDGDVFAEHNLNRQLLSTERGLGRLKADVAAERVADVNGAVQTTVHCCFLDESNADDLIGDANVVLDGLDSIPARLTLQEAASRKSVPLVHGAIAGFYSQVMSIFPGDEGLFRFYRRENPPRQGIEAQLGNPAATPMLCAAIQVSEAVKILVGIGTPLRDRLLTFDARDGYAAVHELS